MQKIDEIHKVVTRRKVFNVGGVATERLVEEKVYRPVKTQAPFLRFLNYLVDLIGIAATWFIFLFVLFAFGMEDDHFFLTDNGSNLLFLCATLVYYTFMEGTFGKTLGKLITGSRVIDQYGNKPGYLKAFIRSACRLIPFEVFSCFSDQGWHDSIPKTWVVSNKEYKAIRALLEPSMDYDQQDYQGQQAPQQEDFF
ncbi:MAG: RDD family protein [Bacteroidia bacterium]|nr:RDD family protein [Bacteroidia bacterium]